MAHVVGVPRRDPCQKCKLPVFLAERLTVGKRIFHRTCLKCARCGSQLTPGSFYETEVDDEYCCETCPDEEEIAAIAATAAGIDPANADIDSESDVVLRNAVSRKPASAAADATTSATTGAGRSSILARLAFFEKNKDNPSMRLSSCTDEEKTRQRAALVDPISRAKLDRDRYLANDAESDDCTDKSDTPSSAVKRGGAQLEMSDTEADDDDDLRETQTAPPELPKSQPPPIVAFDEPIAQVRSPSKRFTATAQLQLVTTDQAATTDLVANEAQSRQGAKDAEDNDNIATSMDERHRIGVSFNLSTPAESTATTEREDSANNNEETGAGGKGGEAVAEAASPARTHAPAEKREGNNVDLSPTNVRDVNVTKDKTAVRDTHTAAAAAQASIPDGLEQMKAELQALDANSSTDPEDVADSHVEVRKKPQPAQLPEDAATTERLSVVRARLQQFEVIANTKNNNVNIKSTNPNVKPTSPENLTLSDCIETKSIDKDDRLESHTESEAKANANAIVQLDQELESESVNREANDEENDEEKPMEIDSVIAILETRNEVPLSAQTEDESDSSSKIEMDRSTDVRAVRPAYDSDDGNGGAEDAPATPIAAQLDAESVPKDERTPPTAVARSAAGSPAQAAKGEEYPDDMNPFNSDDDEDNTTNEANKENRFKAADAGTAGSSATLRAATGAKSRAAGEKDKDSLNPFDSSDDEIELEKSQNSSSSAGGTPSGKVPPPRPPPPRISRNPFGDDEERDDNFSRRSSLTSSITKKTPVPTPRTNLSQNPTPEPTPRLSNKTPQVHTPASSVLQNSSDYYGSVNSLSSSSATTTPQALLRNSGSRGSNNSLTSSAGGTIRSRKSRRAPAPPLPVKELFPSTETVNGSKASTPSSSNMGSPKSNRKKRPAPAPPKPARLDASQLQALPPQIKLEQPLGDETNDLPSKNLLSYPLQSDLDSKLSDEEKALLEGKQAATSPPTTSKAMLMAMTLPSMATKSARNSLRLIPLDPSLLEDLGADGGQSDDVKHQLAEEETNVVYRRVLVPSSLGTPIHEANPLLDELNVAAHDRQLEKLKDNKEAQNRNRQSQHSAASSGTDDGDGASALYSNKSSHGKWKRRKGPAPALPIPPRRVLQMLPLQEIRHELDIIEVQQQGLEKQGVILEKMIRDRCEGQNGEPLGLAVTTAVAEDVGDGRSKATATLAENTPNSKEVEDLILQLFELVNEKNELFRRQAELMYLRRQHRLEQEQADLEYEIRVLMAQPERNKTDTDKSREEALIARLVEVVQLRNEVIDCLEMDRLREAEEDLSIKQRLELHTAQRGSDEESKKSSLRLLSKKEKKKHKESKKLSKSKKIDADKDADETELSASDKPKLKKKKRKFLF